MRSWFLKGIKRLFKLREFIWGGSAQSDGDSCRVASC